LRDAVGHPAQRPRESQLVHALHAVPAEIAQGRLEALLTFQTLVEDLTGLPVANASLLDEPTAAAEAMTMLRRVQGGSKSVFVVSTGCFPQTIDVLTCRAEPSGSNWSSRIRTDGIRR